MKNSFIRSGKRLLAFVIIFISLSRSGTCLAIEGWVNGTIIDKETGLPIEDVVLVRSWTRVTATPAGQVTKPLGFVETNTDQDGKFSFPIKILPGISIPVFSQIEENRLIAYKPGYKFIAFDKGKTSVVEMEKVPPTYFLRHEENEKARNNYATDSYSTNRFNELVTIDEKFSRVLPRQLKAIFSFTDSANDIDFDKDGNVYVSNYREIAKYSPDGQRLNVGNYVGSMQITGSYKPIDIEVDKSGDILAFMKNEFLKLTFSEKEIKKALKSVLRPSVHVPFRTQLFANKDKELPANADLHAVLAKNQNLFLISPGSGWVKSYDPDAHLHCEIDISENNLKITDITSGPDDSILISYSKGPTWKGHGYGYNAGVLKLDENCREIDKLELDLEGSEIKSVAVTAKGNIVASTENRFYLLDKDHRVVLKETIQNSELGEVDIKRIKVDTRTDTLYLIDGKYNRLFRYDLQTKKWYNPVYTGKKVKLHLRDKYVSHTMYAETPAPAMTMPPVSQQASSLNRPGSVSDMMAKIRAGGARFNQLEAAMKDKNRIVRLAALRVLEETQNPKAKELLAIGLKDPDMGIRSLSAEVAGKLHTLETVGVLRALLIDKKEQLYVRRSAAVALGEIKDIDSVPLLVAVMKEEFPPDDKKNIVSTSYFKGTIVEVLGKIDAPQAFDVIVNALENDDVYVRKKAVIILSEMKDKRAVRHLIEAFNENYYHEDVSTSHKDGNVTRRSAGNFSLIQEIINAFVKLNDPDFIPPLTVALGDSNEHIRKRASKALTGFRDERVIKPSISVLGDHDPEISGNAAQSLVMIGTPSVNPVLTQLSSSNRMARMRAAYVLGEVKDERAVMPLIQSLKDIDSMVRWEAAKAFTKIRDERAIPDLIHCLKDEQRQVREAASDALTNIGAAAVAPLIVALHEKDLNFRINVIDTLTNIGHVAVGQLVTVLADKDLVVRWIAARLLENIGDEACDEFLEALRNNQPEIRWRTAEVLGNIGCVKTGAGLIALLQDKMPIVRWKAAEALGKVRDPRALEPLSLATKDANALVKRSADWSLAQINKNVNTR